jgi:hypothetical protein
MTILEQMNTNLEMGFVPLPTAPLGRGVEYGPLHRVSPHSVNSESMKAILGQNLPYDERDAEVTASQTECTIRTSRR